MSSIGPGEWNYRWPHFSPEEIACHCCGELPEELDDNLLDRLELLREKIGQSLRVNSGYRCRLNNARVGGAPYSQHKRLAVDLALGKHDPLALYNAALECGFLGIGLGGTFIHLDMRNEIDGHQPPKKLTIWYYSASGRKKWQEILDSQNSAQPVA